MGITQQEGFRPDHRRTPGPLCPFGLTVEPVARFLNCELVDDAVYDGLELQYFDDTVHGTGMLAFLSRRGDRRVDYHLAPGLRLDPATFTIGGGVGAWTETRFERARLEVAADGLLADVRFEDVDGRVVEVRIDDRDGRPRSRGRLLAPVGAGIERPGCLLLVYLHDFDLVRSSGREPSILIDGRPRTPGRLPGARLHRRHLIKYAAPLTVVKLNAHHEAPTPVAPGAAPGVHTAPDGRRVTALTARHGAHHARFSLSPALPDLAAMDDGTVERGGWHVDVDGTRLTGGTWDAVRRGQVVELSLDVTGRWRPTGLPAFMRVVTRVVPTFRQWPTTYRWTATLSLGEEPTMGSHWERTGTERGEAYRRATGS